MTLSDFKKRVRIYLSDEHAMRYKDQHIADVANAMIRLLWQKIRNRNNDYMTSSQAINTVSGTSNYALPANFSSVIRLEENSTKRELKLWRWPIEQASLSNGMPIKYRLIKGYVILEPVPSGIYNLTLWYEYVIATISLDTATIGIPESFDEILIQRTALMLGSKMINPAMLDELERSMLMQIPPLVREVDLRGTPGYSGGYWGGLTN